LLLRIALSLLLVVLQNFDFRLFINLMLHLLLVIVLPLVDGLVILHGADATSEMVHALRVHHFELLVIGLALLQSRIVLLVGELLLLVL